MTSLYTTGVRTVDQGTCPQTAYYSSNVASNSVFATYDAPVATAPPPPKKCHRTYSPPFSCPLSSESDCTKDIERFTDKKKVATSDWGFSAGATAGAADPTGTLTAEAEVGYEQGGGEESTDQVTQTETSTLQVRPGQKFCPLIYGDQDENGDW